VVLLGTLACEQAEETEGISIQSTPAELRGMRITAEASGQLEPVLKVEVKSKASGEILELFVDSGDEVELGDTLAKVDPRDVENAWDQAEADYEVAKVRRDLAKEQMDRSRRLLDAEVISMQDFESRELEYANAQAAFVRAETNRELAALRRTDVTISAPMAGTILEKLVEYGQVIQSATQNVSGGTTLFMMANLDNMRVRTLVDETDVGKLAADSSVTVEGKAAFQGPSPACCIAMYRLAGRSAAWAIAARMSGSRTTITCQPWRLPPEGAKRACSSMRSMASSGTGSSVNCRAANVVRMTSVISMTAPTVK